MLVYLVRHGEALNEEVDPVRPLSDNGVQQVDLTSQLLSALIMNTDTKDNHKVEILHSPKKRAEQTALAICKVLRRKKRTIVSTALVHGLLPADDPIFWADKLEEKAILNNETTILVGHLPHLCRLAGILTTGEARSFLNITPASAVALERHDTGFWSIRWFLSPENTESLLNFTSSQDSNRENNSRNEHIPHNQGAAING
ncbi:MAG: phosphohistidine phosphatase SixA [Candidatus Wallbacteria bacterium HGW-Wallbacteria-1]|jgi:phosphohistidine phosphatase|uniref:Phosphohistidine phosphatase SixA n=1 Tax=Candidatus Wallbacteria bacterium HGW-Wallbacteria-1 TaxID=2013854 RepID=A0A2N1PQS5_9BACT|nr:MAG: phosphohistidine phosphatase SixA [Candidatus Wallbacteria bacterium HGW-Wallbacteria-1]